MFRQTRYTMALSLIILAAVALGAGNAAAEPRHDRQGFFLGLDLGAGGGGVEWDNAGQTFKSEEDAGLAGTVRLGYAFNPYFSLSLDQRGFEHNDDDFEYSLNSTALNATVYPMGGGFFLRMGVGAGQFESTVGEDNDDPLAAELDETGGVVSFGLGYDWMVNEHFAIGLSADARGLVIDDDELDGLENFKSGEGSLGLTMNYYF